mmetsp:Transcript_9924/g.60588  ORF Transcript_9924/g.60588 Transcript_9924/m.60588 type:complete len:116 (-) Transcript_9924:1273-1620(-)
MRPPVSDLTTIQPIKRLPREEYYGTLQKGCLGSCQLCSSFGSIRIQRSSPTSKALKAHPRPAAKQDQTVSIARHASCVFHLHFRRSGMGKREHKYRSQACCNALELTGNAKSTNT